MQPSGIRFASPRLEPLESRDVPSTVLSGDQCLVFYLGSSPQSGEIMTREGTYEPAATHKGSNEIQVSSWMI